MAKEEKNAFEKALQGLIDKFKGGNVDLNEHDDNGNGEPSAEPTAGDSTVTKTELRSFVDGVAELLRPLMEEVTEMREQIKNSKESMTKSIKDMEKENVELKKQIDEIPDAESTQTQGVKLDTVRVIPTTKAGRIADGLAELMKQKN